MLQLDIRTSLVIGVFVSLVPSLLSASVWQRKRACPGFGRWTLGNLLCTLCLAFISLRGTVPDWCSIVLSNALALGAAISFFQGMRLFRGLHLYWWPELLTAVPGIAAVIYFRYATDSFNARVVAMSAVLGIFGLGCGFTLLKQVPAGRKLSMILTGVMFILAGAVNLFRMYFYASVPATDLFAPSGPNAAFFAAAGLGIVGWSFGFVLMTDERLALDSMVSPPGTVLGEVEDSTQAYLSTKTVPEAEVRQQLQRIIESDVFRRSARMERFLIVAVERALEGHPEELKEYALGRDVFNRGDNYDPRKDSIVRVEAQRLRRKLREYYESDGCRDPIIVELHPGSYVPRFKYKELQRSNRAS